MRIGRRSVLKGLAASYSITVLPSGVFAQASGPSDASQIDVAKAKAEGKVVFYTSLDTQIVDAVIAPFKEKYGINVEYFRGGAADPRHLSGISETECERGLRSDGDRRRRAL